MPKQHQLQGRRPKVNFINLFTCSFYASRSPKCKKLLDLTVFFPFLGSKHVDEIDPKVMRFSCFDMMKSGQQLKLLSVPQIWLFYFQHFFVFLYKQYQLTYATFKSCSCSSSKHETSSFSIRIALFPTYLSLLYTERSILYKINVSHKHRRQKYDIMRRE